MAEFVSNDDEGELVVLVMERGNIEGSGVPLRLEDGGHGTCYPHIPVPCRLVDDVLSAAVDDEVASALRGDVDGCALPVASCDMS